MKEIQLRDAKAKFSAVIDEAVNGEGSVITRHGRKEAVVISFEEFTRLSKLPSLGWLLANAPFEDGDLPERQATPNFGADVF